MYRFLQLIYLMMPIYAANMAPPFAKFWHGWNRPINERLLGSHKTVVGFMAGVAVAVTFTWIQSRIRWHGELISYNHWVAIGLAAGCGAMTGDSLKSYFKRRLGIAPGESWIPWDQLDFIVGGLIFLWPWIHLSSFDLAWVFGFTFLADIAINHLSYHYGIRETKW